MTASKEHIVKEMIKLIQSSPKDEAAFFEDAKNHKWFAELLPFGLFKPETIKPRIKEGDSYHYPYWPQGIYIERIAKEIHDKLITDENFITLFLNALRTLYVPTDNFWAIRSVFKSVLLLPLKYLELNDVRKYFEMLDVEDSRLIEHDIQESFFSILEHVEDNSHDRSLLREFTRSLLGSKADDGIGYREIKLIYFRDHGFKRFSEKVLAVSALNNLNILQDIVSIVSELLLGHLRKDDLDATTALWRPAVEQNYQNQYKDSALSIYLAILYEFSLKLISANRLPVELSVWKKSDKYTFTRIYIALVNAHPETLDRNECARRIIEFGLEPQIRHEAYHFLRQNFEHLSSEIQNGILDAIRNLTIKPDGELEPQQVRINAWERIKWLHAIKESNNVDARKLYDEVVLLTKAEPEHPDFDAYMSPVRWGYESPISIEEMDLLTPADIVRKIIELKEKKDRFGEPLTEGLTQTFEKYIIKEPVKCSVFLGEILTLPAGYVSSLFDAYTKCWAEKKYTPVDELIDLAAKAFNDQKFRSELLDKNSRARWAATSIFRFISAGVKDDDRAFDPALNKKCHDILISAVALVKPDEDYKNSSDALTRAINEPRGVLFESAVLLALRQARLSYDSKTKEVTSDSEFKNAWLGLYKIIKEPLESQDGKEVSLHAHIGALYRQFMFLERDWLFRNIDLVCPPSDKNPDLWSGFIQGFCYVTVYVKDMYECLHDRGYLLKFLRLENGEDAGTRINTLQEHIISLAIIAVMLKDETLSDGLLKMILDSNNGDEWNSVIKSLPRLVGGNPAGDILIETKKIISFFLDRFDQVEDKESWKKHFEGIGWTLKILKDPSDPLVSRIINIAAYYSNAYWDHYEIVEYLESFKDSHTEVVGKLYFDLLKGSKGCPAYPESKIVSLCKALKSKGHKLILAAICREYSERFPGSKLTKEILGLV